MHKSLVIAWNLPMKMPGLISVGHLLGSCLSLISLRSRSIFSWSSTSTTPAKPRLMTASHSQFFASVANKEGDSSLQPYNGNSYILNIFGETSNKLVIITTKKLVRISFISHFASGQCIMFYQYTMEFIDDGSKSTMTVPLWASVTVTVFISSALKVEHFDLIIL